jgi:hypothetical protein
MYAHLVKSGQSHHSLGCLAQHRVDQAHSKQASPNRDEQVYAGMAYPTLKETGPCSVFDKGVKTTEQRVADLGYQSLKKMYESTEDQVCHQLIQRILPLLLADVPVLLSKGFPSGVFASGQHVSTAGDLMGIVAQDRIEDNDDMPLYVCYALAEHRRKTDNMWRAVEYGLGYMTRDGGANSEDDHFRRTFDSVSKSVSAEEFAGRFLAGRVEISENRIEANEDAESARRQAEAADQELSYASKLAARSTVADAAMSSLTLLETGCASGACASASLICSHDKCTNHLLRFADDRMKDYRERIIMAGCTAIGIFVQKIFGCYFAGSRPKLFETEHGNYCCPREFLPHEHVPPQSKFRPQASKMKSACNKRLESLHTMDYDEMRRKYNSLKEGCDDASNELFSYVREQLAKPLEHVIPLELREFMIRFHLPPFTQRGICNVYKNDKSVFGAKADIDGTETGENLPAQGVNVSSRNLFATKMDRNIEGTRGPEDSLAIVQIDCNDGYGMKGNALFGGAYLLKPNLNQVAFPPDDDSSRGLKYSELAHDSTNPCTVNVSLQETASFGEDDSGKTTIRDRERCRDIRYRAAGVAEINVADSSIRKIYVTGGMKATFQVLTSRSSGSSGLKKGSLFKCNSAEQMFTVCRLPDSVKTGRILWMASTPNQDNTLT